MTSLTANLPRSRLYNFQRVFPAKILSSFILKKHKTKGVNIKVKYPFYEKGCAKNNEFLEHTTALGKTRATCTDGVCVAYHPHVWSVMASYKRPLPPILNMRSIVGRAHKTSPKLHMIYRKGPRELGNGISLFPDPTCAHMVSALSRGKGGQRGTEKT